MDADTEVMYARRRAAEQAVGAGIYATGEDVWESGRDEAIAEWEAEQDRLQAEHEAQVAAAEAEPMDVPYVRQPEHEPWSDADAYAAQWDDDPNPYHGDYSEC